MSVAPTPTLAGTRPSLPPNSVVFGRSPAMLSVQQRIEKVAGANIPILIQGESGTGKEIITRIVHQLSPWRNGPFVKVNCPAIPGTLVESELFGYERGSFTGAYGTKAGRVELANRGTLFLDEIGEMDMDLQAKLLQVLQDGQFCRIGAQEDKRLEARVVCATNRPLEEEVQQGTFRQDLYYRINVVNLMLPPLRDRRGDIPELVQYFVEQYNAQFHRNAEMPGAHLLTQMQAYHWPGNIRELENLVKRYVILASPDAILQGLNSFEVEDHDFGLDLPADGKINLKDVTRQAVRKIERNIILKVLQGNQWNRKKAAKALSISYRALLYKLKETGLQTDKDEHEIAALGAELAQSNGEHHEG